MKNGISQNFSLRVFSLVFFLALTFLSFIYCNNKQQENNVIINKNFKGGYYEITRNGIDNYLYHIYLKESNLNKPIKIAIFYLNDASYKNVKFEVIEYPNFIKVFSNYQLTFKSLNKNKQILFEKYKL